MKSILAYLVILAGLAAAGLYWHEGQIDKAELRGAQAQKDVDQKAADTQKAEAAKLLAEETARADAVTGAFLVFKDKQESKDVQAAKITSGLKTQLAVAAGTAGRLRDPNATPCGRGQGGSSPETQTASSPSGGSSDGAKTGGVLSEELTGLLQKLTGEADEINTAYASCRADLFSRIELSTK